MEHGTRFPGVRYYHYDIQFHPLPALHLTPFWSQAGCPQSNTISSGVMIHPQKYLTFGLLCLTGVVFVLGMFAKIWEWQQPKQHIPQAKVVSIKPYSSDNDLHWSSRGYRTKIEGEDKVIDFPSNYWDMTVREGDTVAMTFRKSFPLFGNELDGLSIRIVNEQTLPPAE